MPLPSLEYYDEQYRKRKTNKPVASFDPLGIELKRERDREIRESLFLSASPDTVARVSKVSRETGEPPLLVEDRVDAYEKSVANDRFMMTVEQYPALGKWAVNNPRGAAAAADDWDSLSLMGKAWQGVKNVGSSVKVGTVGAAGMAYDAIDAVGELTDALLYPLDAALATGINAYSQAVGSDFRADPDKDRQGKRSATVARRERETGYKQAARPDVDNWLAKNLLSGVENVPLTIASALTRNPNAAVSILGGVSAGTEYQAGREQGLSPVRSAVYGATQGTIEAITEKIPMSRLLSDIGKKSPIGKTLINQLIAEVPGEQVATVLQDLNEWGTLNPDKSFGDYLRERPSAAADTFVQTLGAVGTTVGATKAAERTIEAGLKLTDRIASSRRAGREAAVLDNMVKASEASKLRQRDPEAFKEMLRTMGEDAGNSNVYISGEAMQSYMQSDAYDPDGPLSSWVPQVEEAVATNGDVVMPIEDAMTLLPGAWANLKDDVRLSSGGQSRREAQTFDEAIADVMDELATSMAEQERATAMQLEPVQKLAESINRKLQDAGFTPSSAKVQADLLVQRYSTRASRLGKELTGDEFGVTINNVLPEGLAAARKADNLDLVINSYFTMKNQKEGKRKSLLDFIAERGGITDRGGDLKSMGLDNRKFKKKVIRQTAQADMLGAEGNNKYAPDAVLQAAIDEGYFPELQGRDETDGRILLEAIEEELRGAPRYNAERIADDVQELASQLDEFLGQTGYDTANMSRADIRSALEGPRPAQDGGFYQSYEDNARGKITFNSGQATIDLFKTRNLSTFLHETGHLWLEELRFDASLSDAPDELKADWATVNKWFASQGHAVKDGQIPVDAHEMWARGVERYLMEGKAPVAALKRIFETFRVWLTSIYKTVDALKSPITPEIRAVMDRLIATDTEIAATNERQGVDALFKSASEAGMAGAEYAAYVEQTQSARGEAKGSLIEKTMRAFRARETKRYKEAESGVREEITADVDARPMYKALRLLKTAPMDAGWVRSEFGEDSVNLLPSRVPPIAKSGGMHPDIIAEQSGFATGKDMIETLMGADIVHRQAKEGGDKRSMRERTIDEEVDAVMQARYGDVLNDGSIEREALEAVHNDMQGDVIAAEIRVLARRSGRRATPYAIAKDWARGRIRSGVVRDEASPSAIQRYARAAAKASADAQAAMLKQDIDAAFKAKQAQMLNNALVFEAKQALDDVTRAVKRMEKIAKRRTMKSVDQEYLEQAQSLLENVEMRRRSQVGIDRQGSFEAWAAARQAEGFDIAVPPSFEASLGKTNWTRLSVDDLMGLDEAVKQIIHLGRFKKTLLDNKERRDFDELVSEALQGAVGLRQKPPSDLMEPSYWDAVKSKILAADAALLKMETVFDWLDSKNINGVFNRVVFRPLADAQEQERLMVADYNQRLTDALQAVPADTLKRWGDKVTTNLINRETGRPFVFTRDQLVSMALNVGNQSNLDKLTGGYNWQEGEVLSVLAQELTQEEWAYVQSVWDTIETLWPQIEAMERRLNGVAPEKIAARPVETPYGTLAGGYFPVVYDPRRNYDAEANAAKGRDLFETIYTRATTPKGFTKERAKVERPIHLSLAIINRHISEVVHDLTHREAIMQADKFLSDKRIMKAVDNTLGPEVRKMFRPWLQRIANEWAYDRAGSTGVENIIKKIRLNTTIVGMGFRASTILMQAAGYSNSFEVVGFKWVAARIKDVGNAEAWRFVLDNSKEVSGRIGALDRDMRDNVRAAMGKNDWLTAPKRFAFHGIAYMDRMVVVPTWLGAYDKATAGGMAHEDAVYAADKAVRQSQGSGAAKDLAAVQSGRGTAGEAIKLLTMFYSYMSAFYQRERNLGRDVRGGSAKDFPALLARAWWLIIVPPLLAEFLAGRGPDEEEDYTGWALTKIMFQVFGPIPVVRDVAPVAYARATDDPTFGYRFTPVAGAFESMINVAGDAGNLVEGEETKRATRNAIETVGYFTGLTTGQMGTAAQFLVDVSYEEQDPEGFGEWYEGLSTGKVKQE